MKNPDTFSRIIAGAMTWGSWGKSLSTAQIATKIANCLELGLTSFDHADIYGGYTTEADFGKGYAKSGIARDQIQLISKCGIQLVCEARENKLNHYNYTKDYIIESAEQSLKNLKTDYLDLFLLHRPSPLMDPHPIAEAISSLKKAGKIKRFGVSNFTPSQIALIEKEIPVTANQVELSLTTNKLLYKGTLDDCMQHDRMAMAWSPLGTYFTKKNKKKKRIKKVMKKLRPKYNATDSQLLLAWILKHPAEVHPVIGTTNDTRLAESVRAAEIELELEDWFLLLKASQGHSVP